MDAPCWIFNYFTQINSLFSSFCFITCIENQADMSQFGLSSANSAHWSYGSTSAYPPYLASGSLPAACTTPTAAQFNNPALGFSCSPTETSSQDFSGARDCVPSECLWVTFYKCNKWIISYK